MSSLYAMVVLGAAVAGFVQGLSGFAFGMVAMSFWAWVLEPRLAAVLVVFGALTGQVLAAFPSRGKGPGLAAVLPLMLGGLAGIPIGVALLPRLDIVWFKAGLGLLLVLWCPAMLMARRLPAVRGGGPWADGLVGLGAGIMGGIGGFTGVLPTLWCSLRRLDKHRQLAIVRQFNLSMLAVAMAMYVAGGLVTRDMLPMFALVALSMGIPTWLGQRLHARISDTDFRTVVLGLLTVSGVALLASAAPALWARQGGSAGSPQPHRAVDVTALGVPPPPSRLTATRAPTR